MQFRLEHALRRWEQLRPVEGKRPRRSRAEELHEWLDHAVCPIIAELIERPDFRRLARWTIDHLAMGSQSAARALVYDIDGAMTATAQNLAEFLGRRPVRAALRGTTAKRTKRKKATGAASVQIGAAARRAPNTSSAAPGIDPKDLNSTLSVVQFIAKRPWRDLVCEYDYFGPAAELNLKDRRQWFGPDCEGARMAEFMPFLHPPLRLPGDFIQRCLEIRIEYWRAILQRTDVRLQSALVHRHGSGSKYESELRQTIQDVGGPWQKLRDLTDRSAEAPRREAAVRLVQVYAGYRPNADLGWLGDAARLSGNASVFRWWVEHRADEEIPTIVAGALAELAGLYRSQVDVEELIREKVATHRLCLIEGRGRRDAYWDGELLDITWNRQGRAWTLLMAMTEDAKATGQGVDRQSDLGISLRDARRDLKKLLPPELFTHMTSNKGVHRLTLPASDLFCGRFNNREELQEILPAAAKL